MSIEMGRAVRYRHGRGSSVWRTGDRLSSRLSVRSLRGWCDLFVCVTTEENDRRRSTESKHRLGEARRNTEKRFTDQLFHERMKSLPQAHQLAE